MDLGSLLKVLARSVLVLLLGAVLTLVATGYAYTQIPSRYQSTARMLLLLPADARGELQVGSPFLYLPNGLNVLAEMVSLAPTSRDFQSMMHQEGFTSQYEVGVDTESPTITVSVEGSDPQDVIETRDRVIEGIKAELLTIQQEENAPPQQIAHTRVYAAEPTAVQIAGDRFRGVLATGAAGALLTLILAFLIDGLRQRLKARRKRRAARPVTQKQSRQAREPAEAELAGAEQVTAATPVTETVTLPQNEDLDSRIQAPPTTEAPTRSGQLPGDTAGIEPGGSAEGVAEPSEATPLTAQRAVDATSPSIAAKV